MRFSLFGTEIYVSFLFSAVITAMLLFDRTGYILPMLLAVLVHECGHLIVMWILDCAPKRIRLVPASVEITAKIGYTPKNEVLIALAGPMVNIILFLVLWFNHRAFGNEDYLIYGIINLLIGLFNLIPVAGLDGGTLLFSLFSRLFGVVKASLAMRIIGLTLAFFSIAGAVTLLFRGTFNLSFFIVGLYLAVMSLIKV